MREIPKLQVLCLRAVGSHTCSAEVAFARKEDGSLSAASRLLRSFHKRPVGKTENDKDEEKSSSSSSIEQIPMYRTPCIGPGAARREQASEVDLNHPIVGARYTPPGSNDESSSILVMEYANPALDCIQSLIDSLVELGRMDDSRIGVHYCEEWKANVMLAHGVPLPIRLGGTEDVASTASKDLSQPIRKKRRRTSTAIPVIKPKQAEEEIDAKGALGALSLYNCTLQRGTIDAMVESGMGVNLAVLDLTGVQGLSDGMLQHLLPKCPNLRRLSIKNCRRLTKKAISLVGTHQKHLQCLDLGGTYNVLPIDLLDSCIEKLPDMVELHASGLAWTNPLVQRLCRSHPWKCLSLGFVNFVTAGPLRSALINVMDSLESLALPFCDNLVDNALLGVLGRNLPNLVCLDVRGNGNLNSLTGWYDGRASANLKPQSLTVLARYSNITKQSLEDTRRIHPAEASLLNIVLDGTGVGAGILRPNCGGSIE